jgi:EpsI family protein
VIRTQFARSAITLLLLLGTLVAWQVTARSSEPLAAPLENIGARIADWELVSEAPLQKDVLEVLTPTSYLSRTYRRHGSNLALLIVYYANQRSGDSLHSPRNCLPGSGWEIWSYGTAEVPVAGRRIPINSFGVQNGSYRTRVLYWYQSQKHIFASEYLGKLFLMRDSLLDGTASGSLVRITLADTAADLNGGLQFASTLIPELQDCLGH